MFCKASKENILILSILFTPSFSLSLSPPPPAPPPVWTKWRFCLWCFTLQTSVILPKPGRCTIAGLTVWWRSFSDRSSGKRDLFDCSGYSLVVLYFSSYYSCFIPRDLQLGGPFSCLGHLEQTLSTAVLCCSIPFFFFFFAVSSFTVVFIWVRACVCVKCLKVKNVLYHIF